MKKVKIAILAALSIILGVSQIKKNESSHLLTLTDEVEALSFCEGSATIKAGILGNKKYTVYCDGSGTCISKQHGVTVTCSGTKIKDAVN